MRVLLTLPSLDPSFGGPVAKVRSLARSLASGNDVRVIGCGTADWAIGLPTVGRFHGTPVPRSVGPLRRLVLGADIVHVIGYRDPVGLMASRIARKYGKPLILEPTGMFPRKVRSLFVKRAFDVTLGRIPSAADVFVATSALEAEELRLEGVRPERIRVRPNGIDVSDVLPLPPRGSFRRRLGIPHEAILVLALGRIARIKQLSFLIRAVARTDAWVAIVGPDEGDGALAEIASTAREFAMDRRVLVVSTGAWGSDKGEAFADADCLCMPSSSENFGNAAAEASACGLPVVMSDRAGAAEWLAGPSVFTASPGDEGAFAAAVDEAATAASRARAIEVADDVRARLDWTRIADQQLEIYQEAVSEVSAA